MTPEDRRAYYRRRYAENPEKYKALARASHAAGKESINAARRERHKADPRRKMLTAARHRANEKGLDFDLQLEDIIVPALCPVLGIALRVGGGDHAPSLDRLDNAKGYVRGNVAVISDRANRLKRDGSAAEHRLIAEWMNANDA